MKTIQFGTNCFVLGLIGCLMGCATLKKSIDFFQDPSSRVVTHETPRLYAQATTDLEYEKFAEARAEYEIFLRDQPTSPYSQVAQFNLARALSGLGLYPQAIEKLRIVAAQTSGKAYEIQAQAFYQLSFCYEAVGDKINSLASLLDSYQRKKYFTKEIATAEIPARIAGAYASLGNFDQAKIYYADAEEGVKQLRREIQNRQVPDWLPRTLYYMGVVSLRKVSLEDVASLLRPLSKAQVYLLQSAELGHSYWSKKSSDELIQTYRATFEVIAKYYAPGREGDELLKSRDSQARQWGLAQEFYKVLDEMKAFELPGQQNQNTFTQNIFKSVTATKDKLMNILNQPRIGQDITPDAKERQSLKPLQVKKSQVRPSPAPTESDPNL